MPIYEYQCVKCDHAFEVITSMSAENPACERCGAKTERQMSVFSSGKKPRKGTRAYERDIQRQRGLPEH